MCGMSSGPTYLRGYQVTSSSAVTSFKTIFPGWYAGLGELIHRGHPADAHVDGLKVIEIDHRPVRRSAVQAWSRWEWG